jgi:VWFA-related protein
MALRIALLSLGLVATSVAARDVPSQPSFPSAASVIAVDVSVLDAQGRPVADLRPEDFVLSVDGKERELLSADYRSYLVQHHNDAPRVRFSSNEGVTPGRLLMLVVDEGNIGVGGQRVVLQAADRLLERLTPFDRVSLVAIPHGSGSHVEFTTQHTRIRQALAAIHGTARTTSQRVSVGEALAFAREPESQEWRQAIDRECAFLRARQRSVCISEVEGEASSLAGIVQAQERQSVQALRGLLESLRTINAPKTVVLLSEGLLFDDRSEVLQLAAAAAAARVRLFVLLLDSAGGDASIGRIYRDAGNERREFAANLEELAGMARGTVFRITTTGEEAFRRIADELAGDYLLGFAPLESERDGKLHDLKVAVRRSGTTVRARRAIFFPPPSSSPPKEQDILAQALRTPSLMTELPVRVATYTVREPGTSKVRVLVSAEIGRRGTPPATAVTVGFVLRDEHGKVVAGGIDDARGSATTSAPLSFVGATAVPPGAYMLRLAALDGAGRLGSVEHPLQAELTPASQLELSDLILQAAGGTEAALRPDVETEIDGGEALAYLEIYSRDPTVLAGTEVMIEIAATETEAPLLSSPARVESGRELDRRIVEGPLPLDGLEAGEYVARAVVSVAGKEVRRVSAPFRVTSSAR